MNTKRKGKISMVLQSISIIPLLFFGFLIMAIAYHQCTKTIHAEIEISLHNTIHNVQQLFDVAYPGDYKLMGETAFQLYKGDFDITDNYELIDKVKQDTELDITLFFDNTRILTTICDTEGRRMIGSAAPDSVTAQVLRKGETHFYTNTMISGQKYFSYYAPLYNQNNSIVGMFAVLKPGDSVAAAINKSMYPFLIADLLVMLLIAVCNYLYTRNFASAITKINRFLADVSGGNLNSELDNSVLRRNDEFGDIGRSAINMQHSLRRMIEQDTLTELFNRRSAHRKLQNILPKANMPGEAFSLCIADIDFFKKVNDTYGHDCGDIVLKKVADTLREHMYSCGFAARWGGEEFLLVFDHMSAYEAYDSLEALLNKIRALEIPYNDEILHVTMTFGLADGQTTDLQELLKIADDNLYQGKTAGRNQIVY